MWVVTVLDRLVILLTCIWAYIWYFRVVCLHIRITGAFPNPAYPRRLDDKFLWRKIFDRNPDFVVASDKLESQILAKQKCPEVLLPRTLWTGSSSSDIPTEILSGDVIVKATHGSGYVFPIFAGQYDSDDLKAKTTAWLQQTFGRRHWEWGYFGVKPQLYVEEMLLDGERNYRTTEIKLYVYCGQIKEIVMIYDRLLDGSADVLRSDWTASSAANTIGAAGANRPPPENRKRIEDVALRLCSGFDHMRCDLYVVGQNIYFGEYTVYNEGGYLLLRGDDELRRIQNDAWDIRQSWFLMNRQSGWLGFYAASLQRQLQD